MGTASQRTRRTAVGGMAAVAAGLAAACGAGGATGTTSDGGRVPGLKTGSTVVYWNDMGNPYPTLMQRWADTFQQRTGVKAEVTGGGVSLAEIDPRTMESRKHRGLYLCGEVLDAFGPIGGYNFLWAWATGRAAGIGAAGPASDLAS